MKSYKGNGKQSKKEKKKLKYHFKRRIEMRNLDKILTETEKLQQELHNFVDDMRKEERGKNLSYDALQTIFILFKITELRDDVIDINSKLW